MIADPIMELIFDATRSPEHLGKSHLNFDIGELTSKIKIHREADVGISSKSAKILEEASTLISTRKFKPTDYSVKF